MKKKNIFLFLVVIFAIGCVFILNKKSSSTEKIYINADSTKEIKRQIGIYIEQDNGNYTHTDTIPGKSEGYVLNTSSSVCDGNTSITWDSDDWSAVIKDINQKNLKCYLYFRKKVLADDIAEQSKETITTVSGPSCKDSSTNCGGNGANMKQNGVFDTVDDFGKTYVFRGTLDNNWVKFGKFKPSNSNTYYKTDADKDIWWRIIRINGNGTIRLIYAGAYASGATPSSNGANLSIGNKAYNAVYGDNKYVGFMYANPKGEGTSTRYADAHKNEANSDIKDVLDDWWTDTDLGEANNVKHIDVETGFCNDRELSEKAHSSYLGKDGDAGYGNKQTAYAPWDRLLQSGSTSAASDQKPSLKCTNPTRDLFTGQNAEGLTTSDGKQIKGNNKLVNPVGLITSDEVVFAGGYMYQNNTEYWLYTNQYYWTMSPSYFNGSSAYVFSVDSDGYLGSDDVYLTYGVRPVINLSADTQFSGGGTKNSPFVPS